MRKLQLDFLCSISIIFFSNAIIFFMGCGASSPKLESTTLQSPSASSTLVAESSFIDIRSAIDTLFVLGNDYLNYYNPPDEQSKRQNKATLQFMIIGGGDTAKLTLGFYPAEKQKYAYASNANRSPLLVLKNAKTGSNLTTPVDTIILGDQQLAKLDPPVTVQPHGQIKKILKLIKVKLTDPSNQVVLFAPIVLYNHLTYGIYVVPKPASYLPNKQNSFVIPASSFIANADPSPPATSED